MDRIAEKDLKKDVEGDYFYYGLSFVVCWYFYLSTVTEFADDVIQILDRPVQTVVYGYVISPLLLYVLAELCQVEDRVAKKIATIYQVIGLVAMALALLMFKFGFWQPFISLALAIVAIICVLAPAVLMFFLRKKS